MRAATRRADDRRHARLVQTYDEARIRQALPADPRRRRRRGGGFDRDGCSWPQPDRRRALWIDGEPRRARRAVSGVDRPKVGVMRILTSRVATVVLVILTCAASSSSQTLATREVMKDKLVHAQRVLEADSASTDVRTGDHSTPTKKSVPSQRSTSGQ